jgi:hypothetical protein
MRTLMVVTERCEQAVGQTIKPAAQPSGSHWSMYGPSHAEAMPTVAAKKRPVAKALLIIILVVVTAQRCGGEPSRSFARERLSPI